LVQPISADELLQASNLQDKRYTLDQAISRIESDSPLAINQQFYLNQANAAILGSKSLNEFSLTGGLILGGYRVIDQLGPEDPTLIDASLQKQLFDRNFTAPRLSAKLRFQKPIWDSGKKRASVLLSLSERDVQSQEYHVRLFAEKNRMIALFFAYQLSQDRAEFLAFKRDRLYQLISENDSPATSVNTASELTLKTTILDYEESLFLLSQTQLESQKLHDQMKVLLGHSLDDQVEFVRVKSAAIQSEQLESALLSAKRQLNRANHNVLSHQITQVNASDGLAAAVGTFYEHNLFSSQRIGLELNIMMPIFKSSMAKAKKIGLKEQQLQLDAQLVQTERQENQNRQQLRAEIKVLESHLTLTDRRLELATQKLEIDQSGHQNGLTSLMALFTTEIAYREALLRYRMIQYEYLERIYIYNLSVSKPDAANWEQLGKL
jgi:hypothetical protein